MLARRGPGRGRQSLQRGLTNHAPLWTRPAPRRSAGLPPAGRRRHRRRRPRSRSPLRTTAALPSPAATATVREAAKPFLVAGLHRRAGRPIVLVAQDADAGPGVVRRPPDLERRPAARPALPRLRRPALRAAPGGGGDGGGAGGDADPARRGARPSATGAAGRHERVRRDRRSALPRRHLRPGPADHAAPAGGVRRAGARRHAPAERYDLQRLVHQLAASGYERAGLVETPGSFSQRGRHRGHLPAPRRGPGAPRVLRRRGGEHPGASTRRRSAPRRRSTASSWPRRRSYPCGTGAAAAEALRQLDWSTLRQEVREEWDWQVRDLEAGAFFAEAPFFARYLLPDQQASLLDYLPGCPRAAGRAARGARGAGRARQPGPRAGAEADRIRGHPGGVQGSPAFDRDDLLERLSRAPAVHLSYRPAAVPQLETSFSGAKSPDGAPGRRGPAPGTRRRALPRSTWPPPSGAGSRRSSTPPATARWPASESSSSPSRPGA